MSTLKHTPGPWETAISTSPEYKPNGEAWDVCLPDGGDMVADLNNCDNAKANAEHIVKCVNCHDELLEACKIAEIFARGLKQISPIWNKSDDADLNRIRQAIAKATDSR